jgi:DNA-binding MarR family transcriptional regulator
MAGMTGSTVMRDEATSEVGPGELTPRLRLGILRLGRKLRQQHAEGEVTASMLSALSTIDRAGPMTLGEVASLEQVQPPTMTRIVGRLVDLGLVGRTVDEADRRVQRVAVTKEGRRFVERSRSRRDAYLAKRLARLTEDERAVLARAVPLIERLAGGDE